MIASGLESAGGGCLWPSLAYKSQARLRGGRGAGSNAPLGVPAGLGGGQRRLGADGLGADGLGRLLVRRRCLGGGIGTAGLPCWGSLGPAVVRTAGGGAGLSRGEGQPRDRRGRGTRRRQSMGRRWPLEQDTVSLA